MSFSHRTVRGAARVVAKKGDAWLERMGVDVFGLRSGAGAAPAVVPLAPAPPPQPVPPSAEELAEQEKEREYEAALKIINDADYHLDIAKRRKNAAVMALGPDFEALPYGPKPGGDGTSFAEAVDAIQPKLKAARTITAALMAPERNTKAEALAGKAEVQARNPGLSFANTGALRQAVTDARGRRDAAMKNADYLAADQAIGEIQKHSEDMLRPYDTLYSLDKNKALFAKAEAVLAAAGAGAWAGAAGDAAQYAGLVQTLQDELAAENHEEAAKLLAKRIKMATNILRKSCGPAAQKWYDDQRKDPAEAARGQAIAGRGIMTPAEAVKQYRDAIADGFELKDITPSEVAAIDLYSRGGYSQMNNLLREPPDAANMSDDEKRTRARIDAICRALDKLPNYAAAAFPLFRWETPYKDDDKAVDHLKSRYTEGQEFVVPELWSTGAGGGADASTAKDATAEIVIWGNPAGSRGKDVSMLTAFGKEEGGRTDGAKLKGQGAGEALFPPGTKFKTMKVHEFEADGSDRLQRRDAGGLEAPKGLKYRIEVMEVG